MHASDEGIPTTATRRRLLHALATGSLLGVAPWLQAAADQAAPVSQLRQLETLSRGRLGVAAFDTASGSAITYRSDERFPFCSTVKLVIVGGILQRSEHDSALLQQRLRYARADLMTYSPVTEVHLADGMTVAELCDAAIRFSDNTAANLLIQLAGGPAAITAFARTIGDASFRLDRRETALNTAIPGDARDSTTPTAMARTLQRLALGDALAAPQRRLLEGWLRGNTTGDTRIRAGVPAHWQVGDKTGTGAYGTTNDIGVVWRPAAAPLVLALYFTQPAQDARARNDVLASATRIIAAAFG